jgi:Ca2+-binding EF-hand superfamily protein
MNNRRLRYALISYGIAPLMITAGFVVSGSLIVGLANADITPITLERSIVTAKKLDINDDGFITLDELTNRQKKHFQKLDHNNDGQIDKAEFNSRLVAMFNRIDRNRDGMLDDDEISKSKNHHHGKRL